MEGVASGLSAGRAGGLDQGRAGQLWIHRQGLASERIKSLRAVAAQREAQAAQQGNPTDAARPYQHHETQELLARIRDLQRDEDHAIQEANAAQSEEDRRHATGRQSRIWETIAAIDAELAHRRVERETNQD
jgi:hypothetical protein